MSHRYPARPRRRWVWIALALLLTLFAAASRLGALPFIYAPAYTPKTMTTIASQRTTHCIGRYLITLPTDFELITGGWGDIELYYGLDANFQRVYATVKSELHDYESFWKEVNRRQSELKGATNAATNGSVLLLAEQLGKLSALLRRLGDENYGLSIKTELHVLVGQRYVVLEQESYSKDEKNISYKNSDPAPAEARLKMIASKLLPYRTAERAKPGFCMQGVLFDVGQDDETAIFSFRAKSLPDIEIDVSYHAVTGQPREGILTRRKGESRIYPEFLSIIATAREGLGKLGGAPAEESLIKTTRPVTQHNFRIERRDAERRTLDRPFFGIALTTGNEYGQSGKRHSEDNASLSDAQVLSLWDEIVASVHKR
ncbi:hypothetical protein J2W25_002540 [Variovorax boronicumulans]|uniref:Tle cognate immunity protein 4 C-terminal domain-containing protein n=1 Tax=Variovorax boronicumulans TaxID=436515 RepID=A0AAW8DVZ9_9BURK|nr:T6SS immunity protein Tli4 family protein [Variovorax boronicumulans]MDP9878479.1 hypothetical protein [Variovorax boronicumulans]MDP9923517.1 hypothetical protein [Variovorax boronicumulans]